MHQHEMIKKGEKSSPEADYLYSKIGIAQAYKFMKHKKDMMRCIEAATVKGGMTKNKIKNA